MTALCPNCKLPDPQNVHVNGDVCAGAQAEATLTLLRNVGERAACSGCGTEIYWVRHKNGKPTPYNPSGLSHFVSCPKADQFRRRA